MKIIKTRPQTGRPLCAINLCNFLGLSFLFPPTSHQLTFSPRAFPNFDWTYYFFFSQHFVHFIFCYPSIHRFCLYSLAFACNQPLQCSQTSPKFSRHYCHPQQSYLTASENSLQFHRNLPLSDLCTILNLRLPIFFKSK